CSWDTREFRAAPGRPAWPNYMTPRRVYGTIPDMPVVMLAAIVLLSASLAGAQTPPAAPADRVAQAYEQFLLGRRLETSDKVDAAIAAYKRAMQLDASSSEIPAELSALYLRQNRGPEALSAAEQALKINPANR